MDINHLLSSHQIALMQADAAGSREAELMHRNRARCYADHIRTIQTGLGATPMLADLT